MRIRRASRNICKRRPAVAAVHVQQDFRERVVSGNTITGNKTKTEMAHAIRLPLNCHSSVARL